MALSTKLFRLAALASFALAVSGLTGCAAGEDATAEDDVATQDADDENGNFDSAAAAIAGDTVRECGSMGDGFGVYNITTRATSCTTARRMARRYLKGVFNEPGGWSDIEGTHRHGAYTCVNASLPVPAGTDGQTDTRCTASGGRVVRWQSGA